MEKLWADVDNHLGELLAPHDAGLAHAIEANREAGLPNIDVPALLGKFLDVMIRIAGARRVLEIGTLGGYSTIWMARAVPEGGRVVTLELEPRHAEIARANFEAAGVGNRVEIRIGSRWTLCASCMRRGPRPSTSSLSMPTSKACPTTSTGRSSSRTPEP